MAPSRTVLLDTSFIIAIENLDDPYHQIAKEIDRDLLKENALLLLHWGIVLEVADGYARIGRRSKGNQLLEKFASEDGYQVSPLTTSLFQESLMLFQDRPDKEWGLTDCISFRLMEQKGISEALTADVHFQQAGFKALLLNQ